MGDVVTFIGNKHYVSANTDSGKACKAGKAKITQIYQLGKSKHPYHLIREVGGGSNVYGWVDAAAIKSVCTARVHKVVKGDNLTQGTNQVIVRRGLSSFFMPTYPATYTLPTLAFPASVGKAMVGIHRIRNERMV